MRTITGLVLLAVLGLAACAASAPPSPSALLDPSPTIKATSSPSVEPTPTLSVAATPTESEEPTPTPAILAIDRAEFERLLLSGVRRDLQDVCALVRSELPRSAVGGIRCEPTSKVVDRVTLYLFRSQKELLDAYATWLAAHNIAPRTNGGRCIIGRASEGGYVPGDDHGLVVAERGGCYRDERGMAHYGATLPPFVLAEVDGKVGDVGAVEAWAWRGNQSQPGAPTVWRSTDQ